jgi:hypothetical protein
MIIRPRQRWDRYILVGTIKLITNLLCGEPPKRRIILTLIGAAAPIDSIDRVDLFPRN